MRRTLGAFCGAAALLLAVSSAHAQQTVRVGMILPYSGQFADPAAQMDNGIKLYMMQHGDTVAGRKIEIVRKDPAASRPTLRRLATELIVRETSTFSPGLRSLPTRSRSATCRRKPRGSWST